MPITGLNHAVLFVRDVEASLGFYRDVLGFRVLMGQPGAAFLQAPGSVNDHDLGLFEIGAGAGPSSAGRSTVGLYHLAWEVDTLDVLAAVRADLVCAGALVGESDHGSTKSLYAKDPDGIELEIAWIVPADQLDAAPFTKDVRPRPLDLAAERERFGATTVGGR